jgi:sialate O-acetylesterase
LAGVEVVTSIDTGDPVAVAIQPHFPNKKPVGERLALLALNNLYGMPCEAHSPQYASFAVEGNKIRVKFKYADGLRVRGGGKMIGFAIRGATGDWVWADGEIDGTDILLSNDQVPQPAAIRYAWAFNHLISIENGAGLPLRPFRTDKSSPE